MNGYFALSTIDVVFVGRAESKLERELEMLCAREDPRSSHGIRIILITCSQQIFDTHDHSKLLVLSCTRSHSRSRANSLSLEPTVHPFAACLLLFDDVPSEGGRRDIKVIR